MPRNSLLKIRNGPEATWTSANPVLAAGEPGFSTDNGTFKIGDGVTSFSNLPDYRNGKFANIITISKTDKFSDFVCSDSVYEGSDADYGATTFKIYINEADATNVISFNWSAIV